MRYLKLWTLGTPLAKTVRSAAWGSSSGRTKVVESKTGRGWVNLTPLFDFQTRPSSAPRAKKETHGSVSRDAKSRSSHRRAQTLCVPKKLSSDKSEDTTFREEAVRHYHHHQVNSRDTPQHIGTFALSHPESPTHRRRIPRAKKNSTISTTKSRLPPPPHNYPSRNFFN